MRTAALAVAWACLTACLAWTAAGPLPAAGLPDPDGNPEENEVLPVGGGGPAPGDDGDPGRVGVRARARLPPTTGSWDWARWPLTFTTEYSAAVRPLARRRGCLSSQQWRGAGTTGARAADTGGSPEQPEQDVAEDGGEDAVGPGPSWSAYWTPQEHGAAAASGRLPMHRGSSVGRKVLYRGAVPPAVDGAPMSLALPLPPESIPADNKTRTDADVAANLLE